MTYLFFSKYFLPLQHVDERMTCKKQEKKHGIKREMFTVVGHTESFYRGRPRAFMTVVYRLYLFVLINNKTYALWF